MTYLPDTHGYAGRTDSLSLSACSPPDFPTTYPLPDLQQGETTWRMAEGHLPQNSRFTQDCTILRLAALSRLASNRQKQRCLQHRHGRLTAA